MPLKPLALILLTLLLNQSVLAFQNQEDDAPIYFEGSVTFQTSYNGRVTNTLAYLFTKEHFKMVYESSAMPMMGSQDLGEVIYDFKNLKIAKVKHKDRTVVYKPAADIDNAKKPEVTPKEEWTEVLGHRCRKYEVKTTNQSGKPLSYSVWVADELRVTHLDGHAFLTAYGSNLAAAFEHTDGLVLRIDMFDDQGNAAGLSEAIELRSEKLNDESFKIPGEAEGYKVSGNY